MQGASITMANAAEGYVTKNVTVKNSTVIAHRNAGALVGNAVGNGNVSLQGTITLDNVSVQTVGGRSGLIVGVVSIGGDKTAELDLTQLTEIKTTNSSYSIYQCAQNTGTFEGQQLGFDASTNILWSYAYDHVAGKNMLEDKRFFEGAYATAQDKNGQYKFTALDAYVK